MSGSEASPAEQPASPGAAPEVSAESAPSPADSQRKEELLPVGEKISELNDSQSELLGRLRGLKEDLENWRSNLDTQVTKYKVELSDIKSALNNEIEQLRSDFQELRTTLKKQQEDVSLSLMNLGVIAFLHSCFVISVLWELSLRNVLKSVHLSFKMLLKMM